MYCVMQWDVTDAFKTPHHPLSHALLAFHKYSSTAQIHICLSNCCMTENKAYACFDQHYLHVNSNPGDEDAYDS